MPTVNEIREARAELQKLIAESAEDKAFGMFSPGLQKKITETRKNVADLTKELGRQKEEEKLLRDLNKKRADEANRIHAEEQRQARAKVLALGVLMAGYAKVNSSVRSLRQAGLENTVEMQRQELAYQMLGREIAAVFLPATNAASNASLSAARAMSSITDGGQNVAFVISAAATGLVTFTAAQLAATAAGIKFTGVLGVLIRRLPLIGLGGGVLTALGLLFVNTKDGAEMMNKALEAGVKVLNEMGDAVEVLQGKFGNGGWFDKFTSDLGIGMAVIGEKIGVLEQGAAREVFKADIAARRDFKRENNKKQVTLGMPRFEGVSDAFERVQIAAAKAGMGGDSQKQQIDLAKKQLAEQEKTNEHLKRAIPIRQPLVFGADF